MLKKFKNHKKRPKKEGNQRRIRKWKTMNQMKVKFLKKFIKRIKREVNPKRIRKFKIKNLMKVKLLKNQKKELLEIKEIRK